MFGISRVDCISLTITVTQFSMCLVYVLAFLTASGNKYLLKCFGQKSLRKNCRAKSDLSITSAPTIGS